MRLLPHWKVEKDMLIGELVARRTGVGAKTLGVCEHRGFVDLPEPPAGYGNHPEHAVDCSRVGAGS